MTDIKSRFWTFFVYPDSAPKDWIEKIQFTGLPFKVSPLHDSDRNPDGSLKKPHYHVVICYNGPTTYNHVKKTITDPLNQPHPQYVSSVKGIVRYFSHLDNPEKFQYNPNDSKSYNGFCDSDFFSLSTSDEDGLYDELENFIISNNITEFFNCILLLKLHGETTLLSFFRRHTIYFRELIDSNRYRTDKPF